MLIVRSDLNHRGPAAATFGWHLGLTGQSRSESGQFSTPTPPRLGFRPGPDQNPAGIHVPCRLRGPNCNLETQTTCRFLDGSGGQGRWPHRVCLRIPTPPPPWAQPWIPPLPSAAEVIREWETRELPTLVSRPLQLGAEPYVLWTLTHTHTL